ncbi:MAG: LacI family DNA-binding transcriptional regulator [Caldilineaceae bacterium]|nr:LacI family DNA-binding transcriptional regulator [Caldilineaceae bacterium]
MSTTMRDVAALVGVSIKTVSNVVNQRPYVSADVRAKVLEAIATLDYRPNRTAQALRTRRARSLAAIVPDIQNSFFTSVIRGIEDSAHRAGYMLFLCDVEDDLEREEKYIDILSADTVAGVVLCTSDETRLERQIDALAASKIPLVLLERVRGCLEVDTILAENAQGSYEAVQHLLETGHQRIAIIAGPDEYAPGRERLEGYKSALHDHGLSLEEALVRRTDFTVNAAQEATTQLLQLSAPPSALLVCSGLMALGTVQVIRERGLRMPEDLALIIFDDPEWSKVIDPPITTIAQPAYAMGQAAAELLLQRIQQPDIPPQHIRLSPTFMHRQSCC